MRNMISLNELLIKSWVVRSTDTKQFVTTRRVKSEILAWTYWWSA